MFRKFFSTKYGLPPESPLNRSRQSNAPAALRRSMSVYQNSYSNDAAGLRLPPLYNGISYHRRRSSHESRTDVSSKRHKNSSTRQTAYRSESFYLPNANSRFPVFSPPASGSLKCPRCSERFNLKKHLVSHLKAVHKKFMCEYCGKELGCKDTLRRHVKEGHERKRSFSCPLCDSSFARGENLKRHFESLHSRHAYHRCKCGKLFLAASELKRHKSDKKHRNI